MDGVKHFVEENRNRLLRSKLEEIASNTKNKIDES
jgi:hypothetical protein